MAGEQGPELRLALAMRGGVSLAVWMGGACREVNALRCALETGDELYGGLLRAAGYGSVAVDVVAGASAGGLNGALMACSVVHGMPFDDEIRNLWLELGDLQRLARPLRLRAELSPLDGDGAFYEPLAETLVARVKAAPARDPDHEEPRLDLSLTGTLLEGRASSRFQDVGTPITEYRHTARFRFRHLPAPGGVLSDLGADEPALRRLAYAARSTSSFPGAFEPASVGHAPTSSVPEDRRGVPPTHDGVFSESRPGNGGTDRDLVIDGGVLDNIPVAWAVRTIAAAPADVQVDRWLVYLQPLPFPSRDAVDTSGRSLPATVGRARSLQSSTETLTADIDELDRLRRESMARKGFAQVLEHAIGEVPEGQGQAEFLAHLFNRAVKAVDGYRRRTGALERGRVARLWVDPMPALGVDPLGFHGLDSIGVTADPARRDALLRALHDVEPAKYEGVLPPFTRTGDDRADLVALGRALRTPQSVARTVTLLLDTARSSGEPALEVKRRIYDVRARVELLVACHDRYLAAEASRADTSPEVPDPVVLVRRAAARLAAQPSPDVPTWDVGPADEWPENPFEAEMVELAALARQLAEMPLPTESEDPSFQRLLQCLLLAAREADAVTATEAVLVATELLTGPLRPDPFAQWGDVRFHMLSAANRSPIPELTVPEGREVDKLAGNQLMNFGAFLSARWRLNDWTWGRLDAACSLVELVVDRARHEPGVAEALRQHAGLPSDAEDRVLRDALVTPLHHRILREELPLFAVVGQRPPDLGAVRAVETAAEVPDPGPLLEVGREGVDELLMKNPSLLALAGRIGLVLGGGVTRGLGQRVKGWLGGLFRR